MSGADPYGEMNDPRSVPTGRSRRPGRPPYTGKPPSAPGQSPIGADYIEVKDRIVEFYASFPEGVIQCEIIHQQYEVLLREETKWKGKDENRREVIVQVPYAVGSITIQARVRKTPDSMDYIGHSFMLMPGKSEFTEGSELENAETSAIGRALAFLGIATKRGIASGNEVRMKRQNDDEDAAEAAYQQHVSSTQTAAPVATPVVEAAAPAPQAAPAPPSAPLESTVATVRASAPAAAPPAAAPVAETVGPDGLSFDELVLLMKAGLPKRVVDKETGEITEVLVPVPSSRVSKVSQDLFGEGDKVVSVRAISDQQRLAVWRGCVALNSDAAGTE